MSCATISDLPAVPADRNGWPWTEETQPMPATMPDGKLWPMISIVTPTLNHGRFIEETLRSVLLQGYPNLEFIVMDGGSTDATLEILREYAPWLTYWESGPDRGQSHAINKGFARCSGELVNWLCSDDLLMPGSLKRLGQLAVENPDSDAFVGRVKEIHPDRILFSTSQPELLPCKPIYQPGCFLRRRCLSRDPIVDENLHYTMCLDLYSYLATQSVKWHAVDDVLAVMLLHGNNKTSTAGMQMVNEAMTIYDRYVDELIPLSFWYRWVRHPIIQLRYRYYRYALARYLTGLPHIAVTLLLGAFYGYDRVKAMRWHS